MAERDVRHKGKVPQRLSWADLPFSIMEEILEYVWYLQRREDRNAMVWRGRESNWQQSKWNFILFTNTMKMVRATCKNWRDMADVHPLWNIGHSWFDPEHVLDVRIPSYGGSGVALPPTRQFSDVARLMSRCCVPCAINYPQRSACIGAAVRMVSTRYLGPVGFCHLPQHEAANVCGVCLKDSHIDAFQMMDGRPIYNPKQRTIYPADDQEVFAGTNATCRVCRHQTLVHALRYKGIVFRKPFPYWVLPLIEGFLDNGDGLLKEVVYEVEQRVWFANHTNFNELHESALACEKIRLKQELRAEREQEATLSGRNAMNEAALQEMLDRGASPDAINRALALQDEEEEEDDEMFDEDFDPGLSSAEEFNVMDMALGGWVRNRILEGCWISPVDIYHGSRPHQSALQRAPPAWHPVNSYMTGSGAVVPDDQDERFAAKPTSRTVLAPQPPNRVFYRAQILFEGTMRQILLPAMENLVKRLIYDSQVSGKDVCKEVAKLHPAAVLAELQSIQVWGVDYKWEDCYSSGNSINDETSTSPTIASVDGSLSSEERDRDSPPTSNTSATTQCTTPPMSPPAQPHQQKKSESHQSHTRQMLPPTTPPPVPTRFLSHIPHIPRAPEHIGHNCWDMVAQIWREACAGLFKCQCRICERASGMAEARRAAAEQQEAAKKKAKQQQEQREQQEQEAQRLADQRYLRPVLSPAKVDVESEDEEEEEEEEIEEVEAEDEDDDIVEIVPPPQSKGQKPLTTTPTTTKPLSRQQQPAETFARKKIQAPLPAVPRRTNSRDQPVVHIRHASDDEEEALRMPKKKGEIGRAATASPTSPTVERIARRRSREEAEADDDMTTASSVDEETHRERKKVRLTPP
ncbi:hypothetical protein FRB94_001167 [Tulasnella sp. JGI-2019a]|nr:hypothetical protein FRB93_000906 [Tulasnella sp. JGI-2019a]KAG9005892.1 hypothetical protein FRB94_001167 [Tulasnella sp. JGI-2019a]KAG9038373.1 hypothetical protein FRB95_001785 [Tulasnella sp. JGI-2019a]